MSNSKGLNDKDMQIDDNIIQPGIKAADHNGVAPAVGSDQNFIRGDSIRDNDLKDGKVNGEVQVLTKEESK